MVLETVGELLSTRARSSFRLWFSSVSSWTLRDRFSRALFIFCFLMPGFFSAAGLATSEQGLGSGLLHGLRGVRTRGGRTEPRVVLQRNRERYLWIPHRPNANPVIKLHSYSKISARGDL